MTNYSQNKTKKRSCLLIATIFVAPAILFFKLATLLKFSDDCFAFFSQILSTIPGKVGSLYRVAFYRSTLTSCSPDCYIGFGTIITKRAVVIEENVSIGNYCVIGSCILSQNTVVASRCSIISGTKQHSRLEDGTLSDTNSYQQIKIGRHCWIGEGAIIGADIDDYVNIAAGAVVLKPVPSRSTAIGNPAKVISTNE